MQMGKTAIALLGLAIGAVAIKTAKQWLPELEQFIGEDIELPRFLGIKGQPQFRNGLLSLIPQFSFDNKTILPVNLSNVTAKVFRLVKGQWELIGQTDPLSQISIPLPANQETTFDLPFNIPVKGAAKNIFQSIVNFQTDRFRVDFEGRILGRPFGPISHQFTDKEIFGGLIDLAA